MKFIIAGLITIHGFFHLSRFIKVYYPAKITFPGNPISTVTGYLWLIAAALFISAALLFLLRKKWWWPVCGAGVFVSQYLILGECQVMKYGTIANLGIFIITLIGFRVWYLSRQQCKLTNRQLL